MVQKLDKKLNNIEILLEVNGLIGNEDREDVTKVFLIPKLVLFDGKDEADEENGIAMGTTHASYVIEVTSGKRDVLAAESGGVDGIAVETETAYNGHTKERNIIINKGKEKTLCILSDGYERVYFI